MTKPYLVIGSGLSALGSIKALNKQGIFPDVIDTSIELDKDSLEIKDRLKNTNQRDWNEADIKKILMDCPENNTIFSIPRKTSFNSDFFYGDSQALNDIKSIGAQPPFSFALGGLAEGWGAAFLPPAKEDLGDWIYEYEEIHKNFQEILQDMHVTGEIDDLNGKFPLLKEQLNKLQYSKEATELLQNLKKGNNTKTILIGKSRLLLNTMEQDFISSHLKIFADGQSANLIDYKRVEMQKDWHWRVHDAIYKPSVEIKSLAEEGKIILRSGLRVTSILVNSDKTMSIETVDMLSKNSTYESYQTVFLAAGCINTARIILNSKPFKGKKVRVKTRGGFLLPAFSFKKINVPLKIKNTMPDFFIEIFDNCLNSWAHIQVALQNAHFENRMNSLKQKIPIFKKIMQSIQERAFVVFVSLHSTQAGHYELELDRKLTSIYGPRLNTIYVKKNYNPFKNLPLLFKILLLFLKSKVLVSPFGKSNSGTFHVGGAFPMKNNPKQWNETNKLGELRNIKNLHLVDSAIFPSLPGTTIGLLSKVMAYMITTKVIKRKS
jgi:hypothetical protein